MVSIDMETPCDVRTSVEVPPTVVPSAANTTSLVVLTEPAAQAGLIFKISSAATARLHLIMFFILSFLSVQVKVTLGFVFCFFYFRHRPVVVKTVCGKRHFLR